MTSTSHDWRDDAACLGVDPELFFPIGSGARAEEQVARAKQVCARCPVSGRCLELAVRRGYEGVWGGTDDGERRSLRRIPTATAVLTGLHRHDRYRRSEHRVGRHRTGW